MEALAAIGLIANIVQFVDLGGKLIRSAKEMQASASGMTTENKSLEEITTEMRDLSTRLDPPTTEAKSDDERALRRLAQQCRELSEQILGLLKKIAPANPKSTRHIMRSTMKNFKYKNEKKELEEKLADCRGQLHLHFSKLTSSEAKAKLQALSDLAESNHAFLQALPQQMERIRRGTYVASLSVEAQDQIKALLGLTVVAKEALMTRHFLEDIAFEGMHGRADVIEKEHSKTFRWIVEQDADVDKITSGTNARKLYLSWLNNGTEVFYIAGKLGSGKSTLMKFLFKHPETRKQLATWAGQAKLVMASHFFWKPGKLPLQKSLNGMIRSLLYDILKADHELTRSAFPKMWEEMMNMKDGPTRLPHPLSTDEIYDGFMALVGDKTIQSSYRFCFFIDALDEYEDSHQHDHRYMVDALRDWTQISPAYIKLCVSSREHNVFENAFAHDPRIRLQDLTRHDMEQFARSKLEVIGDDVSRERLTREIVRRSDGIFLWVVLVIKELRQAMEDGRDTESFETELATLPTELEALFEHLISSIPKSQLRRTYQIFAMVLKHEILPTKLSLLSCLYLDAYEADTQFAIKGPPVLRSPDTDEKNELYLWHRTQVGRARRLLQGYCKGLVEDRDSPGITKWSSSPSQPAGSRCIVFVHRTISEFLQRSDIFKSMERHLAGFDVVEATSQIHLAEIQTTPGRLIDRRYWLGVYTEIIAMRFRAGKDRLHFDFLYRLESVISERCPGWLENHLNHDQCFIRDIIRSRHAVETQDTRNPRGPYDEKELNHPLCISSWLGNVAYVHWRTSEFCSSPLPVQVAGITLHCLRYGLMKLKTVEDFEKTVTCFDTLLDDCRSSSTYFLWPKFLMDLGRLERHSNTIRSRAIGQLIAIFLRKGEKRTFYTTVITARQTTDKVDVRTRVRGGFILKDEVEDSAHVGPTFRMLLERSGAYVSLEELVKFWDLENQSEISGLIRHARTENVENEQCPNSVDTVHEASQKSFFEDTPVVETASQSLQETDSAVKLGDHSGATPSFTPMKSIPRSIPTKLQTVKSHSSCIVGISAVVALLALFVALFLVHQDYVALVLFHQYR